jgi:excisionase family DNA binding protein
MKLHTSSKVKSIDARSIRVALTTNDIAKLLNYTPDKVRRLIRAGKLVFTGDGVADYIMLTKLRNAMLTKLAKPQ